MVASILIIPCGNDHTVWQTDVETEGKPWRGSPSNGWRSWWSCFSRWCSPSCCSGSGSSASIPEWIYWQAELVFLLAAELAYGLMVAAAIPGALVLGLLLFRPTLSPAGAAVLARPFLLCISLVMASLAAEAAAAIWQYRVHRLQRAADRRLAAGHRLVAAFAVPRPGRGLHPQNRLP